MYVSFPHEHKQPSGAAVSAATITHYKEGKPNLLQVGHTLIENHCGLRSYTTRTGVDAIEGNSDISHRKTLTDVNNWMKPRGFNGFFIKILKN